MLYLLLNYGIIAFAETTNIITTELSEKSGESVYNEFEQTKK